MRRYPILLLLVFLLSGGAVSPPAFGQTEAPAPAPGEAPRRARPPANTTPADPSVPAPAEGAPRRRDGTRRRVAPAAPAPDPAAPGNTAPSAAPDGQPPASPQPEASPPEGPAAPAEGGTPPTPDTPPAPAGSDGGAAPDPDTGAAPAPAPDAGTMPPTTGGGAPGVSAPVASPGGAPRPAETGAAPPAPQQVPAPRTAPAPEPQAEAPPTAAPAPARPSPLRRVLAPDWQRVFARAPLGFDQGTPERIVRDARSSLARLARAPVAILAGAAAPDWPTWLAAVLLGLVLGAGLLIERVSPRWWRRWWAGAWRRVGRSSLGRACMAIARRLFLPLGAFLLWSFGGLLAAAGSTVFGLVQSLLAVWAAYRLVDALSVETLRRLSGSREARREVRERIHGLLQFAVWGFAGWLVLTASGYRDEAAALWAAVGHSVLVLGVFALLLRKPALLGLLPRRENRAYQAFYGTLSALYYPLVYFSFLVALLWVAGYQTLAEVFLGRSWALIGLSLLLFGLYHGAQRLMERRLPHEPERELLREQLLSASRQALAAVALLAAWALSLRVLGLLEAWIYLLRPVWFRAGSFEISGRSLWFSFLIVVAAVLFSRWLQATLAYRVYARFGINPGEAYAINRLLHYALMSGSVLLVLNVLGVSPQSLALVAGGLSVGIGFGLQNIANNIASGLIMLTSRQVRQGDVITVDDQTGSVREVNLRSTVVSTFEGVDVIIPNSKLLDGTLINWTHSGTLIRHRLPFGVAYGADPALASEIALRVTREHPEVLADPEPQVWFKTMGASSLDFEIILWVDMSISNRVEVGSDIYFRLLEEFRAAGIEIPFPQRDLHLRSGVPWEELITALSGRDGRTASGNGRPPSPPAEAGTDEGAREPGARQNR